MSEWAAEQHAYGSIIGMEPNGCTKRDEGKARRIDQNIRKKNAHTNFQINRMPPKLPIDLVKRSCVYTYSTQSLQYCRQTHARASKPLMWTLWDWLLPKYYKKKMSVSDAVPYAMRMYILCVDRVSHAVMWWTDYDRQSQLDHQPKWNNK